MEQRRLEMLDTKTVSNNKPRYQSTATETYTPPPVYTEQDIKEASANKRKAFVEEIVRQQENSFMTNNGYMMPGKQKRNLRRKIERMYDEKKINFTNLNE